MKEMKVIMKDIFLYLHIDIRCMYLPTTAAAELAYLILDFFVYEFINLLQLRAVGDTKDLIIINTLYSTIVKLCFKVLIWCVIS